jgi:hypothetical protein
VNLRHTPVAVPPTSPCYNRYAILDSGATGTFVTQADKEHLNDLTNVDDGPTILSASGTAMPTTQKGTLGLSNNLSTTAQTAFVLDDLKTGTLISLAQLCDDDCIAIFTKYDVRIVKDDQVIIKGQPMTNGLWSVPLTQNTTHQVNAILRTDKPKQELATYLHATMGNPATSTLLQAIHRTHLTTIPGLTTNLISKHLPESIAMALGHQDQEAKNIRSTKTYAQALQEPKPQEDDLTPTLETKSHQICAMLFNNKICSIPIRIKLDASRSLRVEAITTFLSCIIMILTPYML